MHQSDNRVSWNTMPGRIWHFAGAAICSIMFLGDTALSTPSKVIVDGPFQPSWASLSTRKTPEWFRDSKFGIWAHWGPQCAPGAGDWYAFNMYRQDSEAYNFHLAHYGHPSVFGFKDVIPLWKAEKFDPERLAALYRKAGARYLVAMASHHDNFDNWDSKFQPWNSVNMGPKRDILRLWKDAAVREGLRFGVSIHNINTWGWFDPARGSDSTGPKAGVPYDGLLTKADGKGKWWEGYDPAGLYGPPHKPGPNGDAPTPAFIKNWFLRTKDLIDNYRPDILEFDLATPQKMWRQWVKFEDGIDPEVLDDRVGMLIAAHYFNQQRKWHVGSDDGIITLKEMPPDRRKALTLAIERDYSPGIMEDPWQLEESMGDWHYIENGKYMTAAQVVSMLVETVCRNGNLLLNVVQKPDGTLGGDQEKTLLEVGRWLDLNGEAIYGSRPWKVCGEGPNRMKTRAEFKEENKPRILPTYVPEDVRFTTNGNVVYAITLAPPTGSLLIKSLAGEKILNVSLLGSPAPLKWRQTAEGLVVQPPPELPSEHGVVFKVDLAR